MECIIEKEAPVLNLQSQKQIVSKQNFRGKFITEKCGYIYYSYDKQLFKVLKGFVKVSHGPNY